MTSTGKSEPIQTTASLQDYFRCELTSATQRQHLPIGEATLWYLTQLLYNYRRTETFFDYNAEGGTLTPLAEYYRQANEATSDHERRLYLQRLGDVSIFISSLFAGALTRKPITVSYYMSMGESAYGYLANSSGQSTRDRALSDIFSELSEKFNQLVGVIAEIKGSTSETNDEWLKGEKTESTLRNEPATKTDSGLIIQPQNPVSH